MSPPSGAASYKKKDGTIAISADEQSVSWNPTAAGAAKTLTIAVANITSTYSLLHGLVLVLLTLGTTRSTTDSGR